MEIGFNTHKLNAAVYKIFKWGGDIAKAREVLGINSNIALYEGREVFLKGVAKWSLAHHQERLTLMGIESGVMFAVLTAYIPYYIPLNKELYFVYGEFPGYHGGTETRWAILTPEEMTAFVTGEGAIEYITNVLAHG